MGNLNKVLLHYEQPWWNGKTGTFLVLPSSAPAPASIKSDAEKKLWELYSSTTLIVSSLAGEGGDATGKGASNSLLVMVGADAGKQLEAFERLDAGNALHAYLTTRIAGEASGKLPKHVFYSRWAKQAFTGGATTSPYRRQAELRRSTSRRFRDLFGTDDSDSLVNTPRSTVSIVLPCLVINLSCTRTMADVSTCLRSNDPQIEAPQQAPTSRASGRPTASWPTSTSSIPERAPSFEAILSG